MAIIVASPLSLYCDASGKEDMPILSVGGFIGRNDEWLKFEPKWNAVLKEFKVAYFHMREFAHSTGVYKDGWKDDEPKRIAFMEGLIDTLLSHAEYFVGACVSREDYLSVDAEYCLHEYVYPYTLCALTCSEIAQSWGENLYPTVPVEYVFEHGDPHRGQLIERVHANTGVDPVFRDRRTIPLQAADFAAWELLKLHRRLVVEVDQLFEKCRKSFERLWELPGKWGNFSKEDLAIACRYHDIERRT